MQRIVYTLVGLACLLLGLALHARNQAPVTFDFYTDAVTLPLSLLMVLCLLIGAVLGGLAMLPARWHMGRRVRRLEREVRLNTRPPTTMGPTVEPPHGY